MDVQNYLGRDPHTSLDNWNDAAEDMDADTLERGSEEVAVDDDNDVDTEMVEDLLLLLLR
jgi:hypothetical protein